MDQSGSRDSMIRFLLCRPKDDDAEDVTADDDEDSSGKNALASRIQNVINDNTMMIKGVPMTIKTSSVGDPNGFIC